MAAARLLAIGMNTRRHARRYAPLRNTRFCARAPVAAVLALAGFTACSGRAPGSAAGSAAEPAVESQTNSPNQLNQASPLKAQAVLRLHVNRALTAQEQAVVQKRLRPRRVDFTKASLSVEAQSGESPTDLLAALVPGQFRIFQVLPIDDSRVQTVAAALKAYGGAASRIAIAATSYAGTTRHIAHWEWFVSADTAAAAHTTALAELQAVPEPATTVANTRDALAALRIVPGVKADPRRSAPHRWPLYLVEKQAAVDNSAIATATPRVVVDANTPPVVNLTFTPTGAQTFAAFSRAAIDSQIAIALDGVVYTAPIVASEIPSGTVSIITGSHAEAIKLAAILDAGPLPEDLQFASQP